MKPRFILFAFWIVWSAELSAAPIPFEIPRALKSAVPDVPAAENNFPRFAAILAADSLERRKQVREARDQIRRGQSITDQDLLKHLRERHEQASALLKPPLRFAPESDARQGILLAEFFWGTEVLARQALAEQPQETDRIIEDLLRWTRDLRHAQPRLIEMLMLATGWKSAFDVLLLQWQRDPLQLVSLAGIEAIAAANRSDRDALFETLKAEFRWQIQSGDVRDLLRNDDNAAMMSFFLHPPFDRATPAELLKLSYDPQIEFLRASIQTRGMIEALQNDLPVNQWPGFNPPARTGVKISDYADRPNGLGDLFYEYGNSQMMMGGLSVELGRGQLLQAALHWLRVEQQGRIVSPVDFAAFKDPVDGSPLKIEINDRVIRTKGANRKYDIPDPRADPKPEAGFYPDGSDDGVIVVPRWRIAETDKSVK